MSTTTTHRTVSYVYTANELAYEISSTLNSIREWLPTKKYTLDGELDMELIKEGIRTSSLNKKKEINRRIAKLKLSKSLQKSNKFFKFLFEVFQKSTGTRLQVVISERERTIVQSRSEYVRARNLARVAYKMYKDTKGTFYKDLQ